MKFPKRANQWLPRDGGSNREGLQMSRWDLLGGGRRRGGYVLKLQWGWVFNSGGVGCHTPCAPSLCVANGCHTGQHGEHPAITDRAAGQHSSVTRLTGKGAGQACDLDPSTFPAVQMSCSRARSGGQTGPGIPKSLLENGTSRDNSNLRHAC